MIRARISMRGTSFPKVLLRLFFGFGRVWRCCRQAWETVPQDFKGFVVFIVSFVSPACCRAKLYFWLSGVCMS